MEQNQLSQAEFIVKTGQAYLEENYFELAIDAFTRAIDLEPANINNFCLRGIAYGKAEQYEESISDFGVYIFVLSDSEVGYGNRGLSYYRKGMYAQAVDDFNDAIERAPEKGSLYADRGLAWFDYADSDEPAKDKSLANALADFSKAILLGVNDSSVFEYRGKIYLALGEVKKALEDFNRAQAIDPYSIDAQINKILALRMDTSSSKDNDN